MATLKLSTFADTLIASEIVRLGAKIKEKMRSGEKIYNFTIGDFDPEIFPIPEMLEKEIITAYLNRQTAYPAAEGELDLREAVSAFIKRYLNIEFSPQEVLISCGGRPLIYAAYRSVVDPGDKVIYPVPSWNNNHYVHFNHGVHVPVEATAENNFMPTAAQLAPHIKGAALVAICSPLNPTGTTIKKEELEKICDLIIAENATRSEGEKKLYLLYDQIYWTLTYGETQHYNPVSLRSEMKNYTIFIDGISKSFASTGVRVGWALGPEEVMVKMRSLNSHVGSWAPMAEQKAVAKFLRNDVAVDEYLEKFKKRIEQRLRQIHDGLQQLKQEGLPVDSISPQAAIYLTMKVDLAGRKTADGQVLENQDQVTAYILNEAKLAIVPFYAFGASADSAWYRLSVGTCKSQEIPAMLEGLKNAILKLS
ncbi:MAG TPA: aminotransferase class I/II-fold pyridoxal phosphate-dependent enzyme [Ferruginibacter sp.]|nr:aminotransferase class I/II-fold pyridoxal phosphate-dependent enzyme [Ferruginibacter sp.]HRO96901.1 aminotransferase class I/II-fold pyridoxal phosphate-dependent enzyme [Ferruginibacter sp.]HRP49999.1 aminotransferase class I/II-fold pyridoxal phosphate-dependent enzyme [Ferruginibacter sp.]